MKKIETATIVRTVVLALALINQLLEAFGKSPIPVDDESISLLISTAATVIAAVVTWWKNQSFTSEAIEADKYMKELKEVKKNDR